MCILFCYSFYNWGEGLKRTILTTLLLCLGLKLLLSFGGGEILTTAAAWTDSDDRLLSASLNMELGGAAVFRQFQANAAKLFQTVLRSSAFPLHTDGSGTEGFMLWDFKTESPNSEGSVSEYLNSGDSVSGDSNSGDSVSGDSNSADSVSGDSVCGIRYCPSE